MASSAQLSCLQKPTHDQTPLTLNELMVARCAPTSGGPLRPFCVRSKVVSTVGWTRQSALENVRTPVMLSVVAPVRSELL